MSRVARVRLGVRRAFVSWIRRYNTRHGVLGVDIRSTVGLGARLEWCLEIMAFCRDHGLLPQFRFSYPDDPRSRDYFAGLFRIRGSPEGPVRFIAIGSIIELDLGKNYDGLMTIGLAHQLIEQYLVVNEDVLREVDEFCRERLAGNRAVGVHYRGTDKFQESSLVPYDRVRRNIEHYLRLFPRTERVFVSTDDAQFLDYLRSISLQRPLVWRDDAIRSRDGRPVHESSDTDKFKVNRDAIVNCLILSRCEALVKTASILSGWSKLFNPRLPVVMLSQPGSEYLWFPERALTGENLFEPLE
jgi:hypothetical protein